ncbi:MAG: MFS transporter [Candidatus Rokubacteria bacterium]|nr:MFS transporter [Candidatus Rokubacteria bacterium]
MQGFGFMNHAPVVPLVMRDAGVSPAAAGFLTTATFLSCAVFSIPLGALTDRFGPKRVTAFVLALLAVSAIGLAAAPSYGFMLATRVLAGVSLASVFVAGGQYVTTHWSGARQHVAQGLHGGSILLGVGAGVFVLPALSEALGWRAAIALSALPAVLGALVWLFAARPGAPSVRRAAIASVYRSATLWRLGIAHTSMFGTGIVLGAWVAVYLVSEFDLPVAYAGFFGSLGLLIGAAGRPVGGVLVSLGWGRPRALIVVTLAGILVALAVMAWPGRPLAVAVAGIAVAGVATSLGFAPIVALAARAAPGAAGAALGLIGLHATFAVVAGAPLVGALWSATGSFTVPLGALALMPAAALVLALGLPRD